MAPPLTLRRGPGVSKSIPGELSVQEASRRIQVESDSLLSEVAFQCVKASLSYVARFWHVLPVLIGLTRPRYGRGFAPSRRSLRSIRPTTQCEFRKGKNFSQRRRRP